MSDVAGWLKHRVPPPPFDVAEAVESSPEAGASLVEGLTAAGMDRLDEARARPGRTRASAFRLLEADALLTYACEAALESEDPAAALRSVLAAVGR